MEKLNSGALLQQYIILNNNQTWWETKSTLTVDYQ
jgi:hypothetical protein